MPWSRGSGLESRPEGFSNEGANAVVCTEAVYNRRRATNNSFDPAILIGATRQILFRSVRKRVSAGFHLICVCQNFSRSPAQSDRMFRFDYMNNFLRTIIAAVFCVQLSLFSASAQQNEVDYKKYVIYNPEPVIPQVVLRNGWGGHIVCVLAINPTNGVVDEVKVVRHTGHAKLDAIMVLTLFSWRFRPGTITHITVGYTLGIYGRGRDLH